MVDDDRPGDPPRARAGSTDARALRSRIAMLEAWNALLLERPAGDIRVQDVTRRARTHRTTFYSHFRDTEDLALAAAQQELQTIDELGWAMQLGGASAEDASRQSLLRLFEYVHERRATLVPLLGRRGSAHTRLALFYALVEHSRPTARRVLGDGPDTETAAFAVGASVFGVLLAWVDGLVPGGPAACVEQVFRNAPEWLRDTEERKNDGQ
jgi:AcrR family transcriptional regulator